MVNTGSFTATGHAYHRDVSEAFARLREATARLVPEASKVTISVTPTFASRWLIPNLPDFTVSVRSAPPCQAR